MTTQTSAVTTAFTNITSAFSLSDATNYIFQNIGNEDIVLVSKSGDAPANTVIGLVLYKGQTMRLPNTTANPLYARTPLDSSVIAASEDISYS